MGCTATPKAAPTTQKCCNWHVFDHKNSRKQSMFSGCRAGLAPHTDLTTCRQVTECSHQVSDWASIHERVGELMRMHHRRNACRHSTAHHSAASHVERRAFKQIKEQPKCTRVLRSPRRESIKGQSVQAQHKGQHIQTSYCAAWYNTGMLQLAYHMKCGTVRDANTQHSTDPG